MRIFTVIFLVFFPNVAYANSMAPIFPLISTVGWLAMPIIIAIESIFYHKKSINNPIKLSLYSNLASATVGLLPAAVTFPIMLGPIIEPINLYIIYLGAFITLGAIIFHWWLSSYLEYKFSQWHKLWKNSNTPRSIFYKANAITYGLITLAFAYLFVRVLTE
jgi:hypothetical protein